MISKTSLFNKGIYKSTVRRYAWGSIFYFIMLFLFTGMMILLNEDPERVNVYWSYGGYSTLLGNSYMIIPMLISLVVPTVAGLLIFRYIHSRKTSVFVHSLPVKRSANFISSVLAALTLMIVPIVLNTVILIIMSVSAYSLHFTVGDCITWMLLNIFSIVVMFSCVCFVASITGNSFAMIGLNVLIHCIALILAAAFTMVCEVFLYGFAGEAEFLDKVFNNSFITRIPTIMTNWAYARDEIIAGYAVDIVKFLIIAAIFYLISGMLYTKRRMETAEDVAGFSCLNHIFKYLTTFIAAIGSFAIFCFSIHENQAALWLTVLVVSGVFYFGTEMLLKKTFRVWRSYKGYFGFVAAFAIMMCVFAFTGFFGFESYVPDKNEIKAAAVYNYYRMEKPVFSDEDIISKAILTHNEMLEEKTIIAKKDFDTRIHIEYELKNGKIVHRVYPIDETELQEKMNRLYSNKEYKKKLEEIFTPMENVYKATIQSGGKYSETISEPEKIKELVDCIKEDMENLSYSQINNDRWSFGIDLSYVSAKNEQIYTNIPIAEGAEDERISYMYQQINTNFNNTIEWLMNNGYWEKLIPENSGIMYIAPDWRDLPFVDEEGRTVEIIEGKDNFIKVENGEKISEVLEYITQTPGDYVSQEEKFRIFMCDTANDYSTIASLTREEVKKLFPEISVDKLEIKEYN